MPAISVNNIRKFRDAWLTAELPRELLDQVVDPVLTRHDQLGRELAVIKSGDARSNLVGRLASGEVDLVGAVREDAALGNSEAAWKLVDLARGRLLNGLSQQLAAEGDGLIVEHLAPRDQELVEGARRVVAELDGINTDTDAVAAGPKTASAWARVLTIVERRDALLDARRALAPLLPRVNRDLDPLSTQYRHPELRPRRVPGRPLPHKVRLLLDEIMAGAEPAMLTASEALELQRERDRAA